MKNKVKIIMVFILLLISSILIVGAIYYKTNFAEQTFETLIYNIGNGIKNANTEIVGVGIKQSIWKVLIVFIAISVPVYLKLKKNQTIDLGDKNNKKHYQMFMINEKVYLSLFLIIGIISLLMSLGLFKYIKNQIGTSLFFENNYVAGETVALDFPEEKRNLIFIFLESMETSLISQDEGGGWDYTVIPELAKLAKENINFSNTNKLGGSVSVSNTTWTAAGMVAQTSGTPIKINIESINNFVQSSFMPGAYSLGDILEKEGYNLEVMFGSDSHYGWRKEYFETHGNYKVFDLNTAINEGKMTENDKVWWGFNDDDLYDWAKEEILTLANDDKPFNFTMLTADTHFYNGYLNEKAEKTFDDRYENVFAYSSKKVYEFIKWIQNQDFYDNTTIVVVGDHIGMQTDFYKKHIKNNDYTRTVYNAFINSAIKDNNSKSRQFSAFDIFPTVLASMGVRIEGNKIGFGTNLFSGEKTLLEEIDYDEFNNELPKRSKYYNTFILQR